MDRPLDIAFHNTSSSEAVEAEIRRNVEKLEKRFPNLIGCRVSIEALHNQHRTGNVHEVHIVLSLPGRDLAVSREPNRAKERFANVDVFTSLREAFRAAERQLKAHKPAPGPAPASPSASALLGQVAQILPHEDHGFILNNVGSQIYFHRDSVTNGEFSSLKPGDSVHYVEEAGDAGPVATKVRIV
jgi:cold shock CspA family protein/ribosome-associated translation inhibitor RaiA